MRKVVGIDRKIKRSWLDAVLDRLAETKEEADLRSFLDKHLKQELPGKESRAKTTGIVLRIWSGIPSERIDLRNRAVAMLPRISGQERIWLHWGMAALAYPFFRDTAEVVGRLLALQDDFTTGQVQARMLTTWGDRATSREASQKLITTLVDWEVLRSTKTKGRFLLARKMSASIPDLQLWLLEALLGASAADEIEAQQLLRLPESFPFSLSVGIADLRRYEGFNIHRQGLDMDMVALRKVRQEQPPKTARRPKKVKGKSAEPVQFNLFDRPSEGRGSNNGQLHTTTADEQLNGADEQRRIEDSITSEVQQSLSERASRFLQVRALVPIPENPFAAPSAECAKQFRDGHFYGCIALSQAVIEAIVHHVWHVKLRKRDSKISDFEKKLEALRRKGLVTDESYTGIKRMWKLRHTFQCLVQSEDSVRQELEESARSSLELLNGLEKQLFTYTIRDGILLPDNPEYWSIEEGESALV